MRPAFDKGPICHRGNGDGIAADAFILSAAQFRKEVRMKNTETMTQRQSERKLKLLLSSYQSQRQSYLSISKVCCLWGIFQPFNSQQSEALLSLVRPRDNDNASQHKSSGNVPW